jgi:hypothetical protein
MTDWFHVWMLRPLIYWSNLKCSIATLSLWTYKGVFSPHPFPCFCVFLSPVLGSSPQNCVMDFVTFFKRDLLHRKFSEIHGVTKNFVTLHCIRVRNNFNESNSEATKWNNKHNDHICLYAIIMSILFILFQYVLFYYVMLYCSVL